MTKRVLSLVLAVLMLFSIMPVYATDSASVPANTSGTASGVDGGGAAGGTAIIPSVEAFDVLQQNNSSAVVAPGGSSSTGGVADGYTISGQLVLGDDVVLENGLLDGFIAVSVYEDGKTDFLPGNGGEGDYSYSFYNKEDYTFSITVPKDVGKVTIAARAYPYRDEESQGEFRTNILGGHIYYIGDCQSTTDYSMSEIITVDGDISGIQIPVQTGVECYFDAEATNDNTAYFWVDMALKTAEDEIIERASLRMDGGYGKGGIVLNKELIGEEFYLEYNLSATNTQYYEDAIYVNPDGTYSLTLEDAKPFTVSSQMQNISFELAKKSEFMKTISGSIGFAEGCDLKNEGFYGSVYAVNKVTGQRYSYHFSGNNTEGTTYTINVPVSSDEYYFYADMWVGDGGSNVSPGTYYYSSEGMVFSRAEATCFTIDSIPESIDFVYGKKASISGKIVADGEIINKENIEFTAYINSETDFYPGITVRCDENLNYSIDVPASVSGKTSMYIYVQTGTNILTNTQYYYVSPDGDEYFNIVPGQDVENIDIKVSLGDVLKGKIKLPDDGVVSSRITYQIGVLREGQYNSSFQQSVEIPKGETEAEFVFALPNNSTQKYMLSASGYTNGTTNIYTDNIYYVSDTQSSENINDATVFSLAEKNEVTFMALTGATANISVKNSYGAYIGGCYYIEFEDGKTLKEYYYLSNGETQNFYKVLSNAYVGKKAYLYYDINTAVKVYINPDGTLTNKRELAKMHTFTEGYDFSVEVSSDKSLYTIPSIKGTVSLPENGYIRDEYESKPYITSNFKLYDESWNYKVEKNAWIYPEENGNFEFSMGETGNYYLSMRVSTYSSTTETNVVTSDTLYYSSEKGWTTKKEEATLLNNSDGEVNLDIELPLSSYISGTITFPDDAYVEGKAECRIEITKADTGTRYSEYVYFTDTEDIDFSVKGGFGCEEYYVSFEFRKEYFSECETNIELDRIYYYSKDGLTVDENQKIAVKKTESIVAEVPVKPTIKGKINLPENAVINENMQVYVNLEDENGNRIDDNYYKIGKDGVEFSLCGKNGIDKYTVEIRVSGSGETNIQTETYFYYTSKGLTANSSEKEYFLLSELDENPIVLTFPKTRTVSGKIIIEDFEGEKPEQVVVQIQSETYGTTIKADLDDDFCFSVKVPGGMQGSSTMYVRFEDSLKNNIIKNEEFYYTNGGEYSASFMLEMNKDVENINVVAETGNVVSGTLILPEDAIFTGVGDLYCDVGVSNYAYYRVKLTEQQRSGDFWLVIPKSVGSSSLRVSPGNGAGSICSNLYIYDDTFYVSDTQSTIYGPKATSLKLKNENRNLKLHLQTGTPYTVNFMKDADITDYEQVSFYIGNEENDMYSSVSMAGYVTSDTTKIVIPKEYYGMNMYLYYDLTRTNNNSLYRERVYINEDGTLTGSRRLADTYIIDGISREFDVTLAQYSDLEMPEYIMYSPYPYKNNAENLYYYTYDGNEDIDYLKVSFAEETYFPTGDYAYIYYGDNQHMGPYRTYDLAGETVNVPGDNFKVAILGSYKYNGFGFAIESIEPKKYTLESAHPYVSVDYPYTHKTDAEGLRLYFSEDTAFSGEATVTYKDANGEIISKGYYSGNLAGRSIDVRGNNFTITLPENTSGNYYGFTIVEIEEIEYFDVTFVNYDGTELYKTEVEKGEEAYYDENDPVRERDEDYIYIFEGWDKSLENVTEDMVVTAQYSENEYYTVDFKAEENGEVLYTDYVLTYDDWAEYNCENLPVKASTETKGYVFSGWDTDLYDIKSDCTVVAEFEEKDILCQSEHPYNSQDVLEYNYEYNGTSDSIMLVFSSDTYLSDGDVLYIYDENDNCMGYTNNGLLSENIIITGKKVKFVLYCDEDSEAFGFALVDVIPMWHDFKDWEHRWYEAPTCTEIGYEHRECRNCYTYEEREVPALGHSYGVWEEDLDGTIFRECIRCAEREIFEGDMSDCGIVNINVVDAVTMEPLEDVTLTAYDENGNETVWKTNQEGVASQMLNKGINNLVVFLDGYIMRNISLDVIAGITDVPVIGLTEKPAVQCKLEAKIMDMEEIKAAGIDISDPLNSHVYKYKIDLGFGQPKDVYFNKAGDYIHRDGNLVVIHEATGTSATIHPVNDKYFLVIYGQSKWLKEMFDVELIAVNTSNTDTVENLVAELKLPDGMSLAAMNRAPQSDVQRMGSLASGESKSVHWYVRGDKEGEYNLSAKLTGTLMPFGEQFGYEYTTDEPVKVYAGSALKMNLVVPAVVTYGEDCIVKIEIENVSDRSVYNLSNSIDKVLQSKLLMVDVNGYEKYFEENALGYVAVDELKPGEKIVAEIKSNVLFKSDIIKNKINSLANKLQNETDILAIFNSYKSTLDLLNDNYDIIYNALGNVTRAKEHSSGLETLENILVNCEMLVKDGVSSRAMYFINRLKQENTMEELTKLSRDANFYTVWESEEINKLAQELTALYNEAMDPENCGDYDIYEDVKRVIEAVPVSFWLDKVFVAKLEGSTTEIPYTVTVIPAEESYTGVTNISNYYYNILTNAIDILSQPWYTETMGKIRDPEGVAAANKIIKTDIGKTLTFAVTDVTGDTRFNAWVEGANGKTFEISSTAENVGVTEGGITFTGPAYLSVSALAEGEGTLYVEKVSEVTTFATEGNIYSFKLESGKAHNCASEKWVEIVTAYDDNDGYYAKYCDICGELIDMKTDKATNDCSSGSYEVTNEKLTDTGYSCTLTFDGETPARSAVAVVIMKDENGKAIVTGTDAIKIKPNSEVKVEVPFKDAENLTPTILLWDSLARLRPVGSK